MNPVQPCYLLQVEVAALTCVLNTWEAEAGGLLSFQGQPGLSGEFLSHKRRNTHKPTTQ